MIVVEEITIIKIKENQVTYSGSKYFDGCNYSLFPSKPKLGKKYLLISDFVHPSKIADVQKEDIERGQE